MLHSIIANTFDATTLATIGFAGFTILNMFVRYTQTRSDRQNPVTPTVSGCTEVLPDLTITEEVFEELIEEVIEITDTQDVELEPVTVDVPVEETVTQPIDERATVEYWDQFTTRELRPMAKGIVPRFTKISKQELTQGLAQYYAGVQQ